MTGNQELLELLNKIDVAETDPALRKKNKEILEHLCGKEYVEKKGLHAFISKAQKNALSILIQPFQDPSTPAVPPTASSSAAVPAVGASSSSSAGAGTTATPTLKADLHPDKLFDIARHKLLMMNTYDRIERHPSDAKINKEDDTFLQNVSGAVSTTAAPASKKSGKKTATSTTKLNEVVDAFGFKDLNSKLIDADLAKLKKAADLKLNNIKTARAKVTTDLSELKTSTEKLINQLSADKNTLGSVDKCLDDITQSAYIAEFATALTKIEQQIKNKEIEKKENWTNFSKRKQLKEEKESLQYKRNMLIAVKKMMIEREGRLDERQKELAELRDAFCLRNIQCGLSHYELKNGLPATDEEIKVGCVYYKETIDPTTGAVTGGLVKFRDIADKTKVNEIPYTGPIPLLITTLEKNGKIHTSGDPYKLNAHLAGLQEIHDWAEDIDQDKQECQQLLTDCLAVAADPDDKKQTQQQANFFLRIHSKYNKDARKMHIVEEIIDQDGKVDKKTPTHGLAGERIVSENIFLSKNQAKRTTCKTPNGNIVIETRVSQRQDKDVVSVVNKTPNWGALSDSDKQEAALLFASDLIVKAKKGDYIRLSGKESDAEQAKLVYAAVLLLLMPTDPKKQDDALRVNISRIKVNVPGVQLPTRRELYLSWSDSWKSNYTHSLDSHPKFRLYKDAVEETRNKMVSSTEAEGEQLVGRSTYGAGK